MTTLVTAQDQTYYFENADAAMSCFRTDQIAVLTLNRPAQLNAMGLKDWVQLEAAVEATKQEHDLRCLIVTGAGGKAFCAGGDIKEFHEKRSNAAQAADYATIMMRALKRLDRISIPSMAMINGLCVGGGLEIAMFCDLRYASTQSRFGVPIKHLGFSFGYDELERLITLIGYSNALELLYEGRLIDANEAEKKGLINKHVSPDHLSEHCLKVAQSICAGAPLAASMHKKSAQRLLSPIPLTSDEYNEPLNTCDSEDYQEGVRAFLEKRRANFAGR
jgi:enoyl-CoA hydratase